jgi:hypothetical protein
MAYACPAWELGADSYLLKMKRLQNKGFRTIKNLPRCTAVRDLHTAFNLPYIQSDSGGVTATYGAHF